MTPDELLGELQAIRDKVASESGRDSPRLAAMDRLGPGSQRAPRTSPAIWRFATTICARCRAP